MVGCAEEGSGNGVALGRRDVARFEGLRDETERRLLKNSSFAGDKATYGLANPSIKVGSQLALSHALLAFL